MRDLLDLPLFMWAATLQPEPEPVKVSGIVIDAESRFLAREMAHLRLIMIGYVPPETGGSPPVYLRERYRQPVRRRQNEGRAAG